MAFKIGNKVVLNDADPSATLLTNSNLDKLQINGTDVFTHDGTTITLQNVDIKDASGVDLRDLATTVNNNTTVLTIMLQLYRKQCYSYIFQTMLQQLQITQQQ